PHRPSEMYKRPDGPRFQHDAGELPKEFGMRSWLAQPLVPVHIEIAHDLLIFFQVFQSPFRCWNRRTEMNVNDSRQNAVAPARIHVPRNRDKYRHDRRLQICSEMEGAEVKARNAAYRHTTAFRTQQHGLSGPPNRRFRILKTTDALIAPRLRRCEKHSGQIANNSHRK